MDDLVSHRSPRVTNRSPTAILILVLDTSQDLFATPYLRRWRLIAICAGLPLAETIVLWAVGLSGDLGIAPQISGPPPFDVFHDLRWLLVFHRSWLGFALGLAVLLVARSLITGLIVREAWPEHLDRPSFATAWRTSLLFTITAVLLMAPWALLLFGLAVVPLSWLFFTAVPSALMVAVLIHPAAVGPGWWRRTPPLRTVGWTVLSFLILTADSVALVMVPAALRPVAAIAAGLFNGWAWQGVVGVVAPRIPDRRLRPWAPVGLVVVAGIVLGGAAIGFAVVAGQPNPPSHPAGAAGAEPGSSPSSAHGQPVLVVTGFASRWDGETAITFGAGFREQRFSYRGLGRGGQPRTYTANDTQQTLPNLDRLLAAQVRNLHRRTHRPVDVVGESEGALIAKSYVLAHPNAPVDKLVMLSPLTNPGRVSYSQRGQQGWGLAAGWGLRGVGEVLRAVSPFNLSPDSPLLRSIDRNGVALEHLLTCPAHGVAQYALVPLADAVAVPPSALPSSIDGTPVVVVPAFHGGLLGQASVREAVAKVLRDDRLPSLGPWRGIERVVSAASSAWQVPSLPTALRATGQPVSTPTSARSCRVVARQLSRAKG